MAVPTFSSTCAPPPARCDDRHHISNDRQENLEWQWLSFLHPCHSSWPLGTSFNLSLLCLYCKCRALTVRNYVFSCAFLKDPVADVNIKKGKPANRCAISKRSHACRHDHKRLLFFPAGFILASGKVLWSKQCHWNHYSSSLKWVIFKPTIKNAEATAPVALWCVLLLPYCLNRSSISPKCSLITVSGFSLVYYMLLSLLCLKIIYFLE